MKKLAPVIAGIFAMALLLGCDKNYTKFYEDEDNAGLSIFSDNKNNLMTCYIHDSPWQTKERLREASGLGSFTTYEIKVYRDTSSPTNDFVHFAWFGNYKGVVNYRSDVIHLFLRLPKRFPLTRINEFSNQRIILDSTNGYFRNGEVLNKKIPGVIFFKTLNIDSSSIGYSGEMSGIFEAGFGSFQLKKGRFDHDLVYENFE